MLEVRNLSKIYKTKQKNGVDTYALDNVTLRFPEKGMVFLLGKSGSGKSTLLNVCGGLDAPTSGEIIVKGRSSKNFSQSDFDSYRNTFVGFIFQEYNILNEFTVEDNIALALELQGKPKDKKAIAELLAQVDLTGYAKRKPNTLSGGQKQRIAIARALVKSPEIIMADEPTGALDSATGKQVFDTLKKLSRDKLVIVVSHDREFAELYADRIIELKDGKILSDVTKTQEAQEAISNNVTAIGDILCIKQGSDLTEADFDRIKSIIKKTSGDVIIAGSEKDVQNFKKVNRITEKGEKEVFKDTDESKTERKTYTPDQSKFIRSKLPARHAAKIGVSGLKTKPVRLFFTIVLCVVSFVLFGVLSTLMLYNSEGMFKQTLKDSSHDFVVFDKVYKVENSYYENGTLLHSYEEIAYGKFNSDEIEKISQTFGKGSFGAIEISSQVTVRQSSSAYWKNYFQNAAYMDGDAFLRSNMIGSYPEKDNEICISSYFAKMLVECKTTDKNGALINIDNYAAFVGKTILIDGYSFKITGIFDSGEIDPKFEALKDGTNQDYALINEWESVLNDGTHLLLGLSKDGFEAFAKRYENMYGSFYGENGNRRGNGYIDDGTLSPVDKGENVDGIFVGSYAYYSSFSELSGSDFVSFTDKITAIKDNEAVIPFNLVYNSIANKTYQMSGEAEATQSRIYQLQSAIINADNEISRMQSEIDAVQGYINGVQADINTAQTEISRLRNKIAEIEIEMNDAQAELDRINFAIEEHLNGLLELDDNEYAVLLEEKNGYEATISKCESTKSDREASLSYYETWKSDCEFTKSEYEGQKSQYQAQKQEYKTSKDEACRALYDEFKIEPEKIEEKLAEYQGVCVEMEALRGTLQIISSGQYTTFSEEGEPIVKDYSVEERGELLKKLVKDHPELVSDLIFRFSLSSNDGQSRLTEERGYDVVGIVIPTNTVDVYVEDVVYFTDKVVAEYWDIQKESSSYNEAYTKYEEQEGAVFTKLYVPYDRGDAQTDYLWEVYSTEDFSEDDSRIDVKGSYIDSLQMIDSFVVELSTIFFYVGLVLAVFAILLFSNFISVSISQKRREIGILRAVGARSLDVFKIFFSESLVIAAICSALSIAGSAVLCQVLNTELGSALGASIFVFGIASILIICVIALLTAILATFLPVWNAAKKKPVDSIRAL